MTGRCFLPIHVYEAITGKPVAVILRPGKTPDGAEVALVLRHVIRRIRARWPKVDILVRGDSHYGRPEAMSWCERNRVGYVFGPAGNKVLPPMSPASPRRRRWVGSRARPRRSAATPSSATPPRPGIEHRVMARSRRRTAARTVGSWSPTCAGTHAGSTRSCTAPVARRKPGQGAQVAISPRTGRHVPGPPRTSSGWCCTMADLRAIWRASVLEPSNQPDPVLLGDSLVLAATCPRGKTRYSARLCP